MNFSSDQPQILTINAPSRLWWSDEWFVAAMLGLAAASAFLLSIQPAHQPFDYTFRTALAFLHGHLGWTEAPPSWLNETVPANGVYYSVFPLGAVLSVLPVALLQAAGLIASFPAAVLASILAGGCIYFLYRLTTLHPSTRPRRIIMTLFPIFAAWFWTNVGFGGAWQIALGFAVLGELGALYFTLVSRRPLVAGLFFAVAFGNRTELILVLPIFLWLWIRETPPPGAPGEGSLGQRIASATPALVRFLLVPVVLLAATAAYNFARFGSPLDFGYARIPNIMTEPWYAHGLFSLHAIPYNAYTMLFQGFDFAGPFPSIQPNGFGCSIFLASPMLFLLFRPGGGHQPVAWVAIAILTFALWCHGNPGGWQFAYRYGLILLPWLFLLVLENGGPELSIYEVVLFVASFVINAGATYLFLWTENIQVL